VACTKEYNKRRNTPEKKAVKFKVYRDARIEAQRCRVNTWKHNNAAKMRAYENLRRRGHPISLYFIDELNDIYTRRPEGYHVDHIVPLKGKGVCGLHVPWNLQYLPAADNLKKGRKYAQTS
jgi:hypothetical protein